MWKLGLFLVFLTLATTGTGLECIHCRSTVDCLKDRTNLRTINCGLEHPEFYYFCLRKVIYDRWEDETLYQYGCDILDRRAMLKYIPQCRNSDDNTTQYWILDCTVCTENLCEYEDPMKLHGSASSLMTWSCIVLTMFLVFI